MVTQHTEISTGTLTVAHLVCRYRDLLSRSGGGTGLADPNKKVRVHTDREDVWTVIYK